MKPARRLLPFFIALLLGWASTAHAQTTGATDKKSYIHTLALADLIRVVVYQEDDLTSMARIDARGRINLQLIGEIQIGGLTVSEAQKTIEAAYRDGRFLRNPQVTISVEEYAPREVSIQGQVRSPARYTLPIESTLSVVDLVTKAGGITDIGKGSAVTITRTLPDGTKKVFTVDVDSLIKGRGKTTEQQDILLQAGDIVYVPESLF